MLLHTFPPDKLRFWQLWRVRYSGPWRRVVWCYPRLAGWLLGRHFDNSETSNFYRTTRRYTSEDCALSYTGLHSFRWQEPTRSRCRSNRAITITKGGEEKRRTDAQVGTRIWPSEVAPPGTRNTASQSSTKMGVQVLHKTQKHWLNAAISKPGGGFGAPSRPDDLLSGLAMFVVFLRLSRQMLG
jgi:hypothetical protein